MARSRRRGWLRARRGPPSNSGNSGVTAAAGRARWPRRGRVMRVSEAMTREVRVCNPGQSISACARTMAEIDAGALPVAERDRLVGMITDRDIAIRAVAAGKGPDTTVRDVMSRQLLFC